jgi:signal peptidase I
LVAPGAGQALAGRVLRGGGWLLAHLTLAVLTLVVPVLAVVAAALTRLAGALDCVLMSGPRGGPPSMRRAVLLAGGMAACFYGSAWVIRVVLVEAFKTPGGSMAPGLRTGDHFFVQKSLHHADRGRAVVYPAPGDEGTPFVKRVVAVAGDVVRLSGGRLFLDGKRVPREPLDQPCVGSAGSSCRRYREAIGGRRFEVQQATGTVPGIPDEAHQCPAGTRRDPRGCEVAPGHVFVLGDHRDNSVDSRHHGAVSVDSVIGVPTDIWLAFDPAGGIDWGRIGREVP